MVYSSTLATAQQALVNAYLDAKWLNQGTAGGTNFLPSATAVNLTGASASLNLGYVNQTIGELNGVAGSTVVFGPNANTTLTTGGDNNSTTFAGTISGNGGLTKVGAGTFTLSGNNTYTGPTAVSGGTLQLGDGVANNGSVPGNVSLANSTALVFANPASQTYSGVVSGSGALIKTSPGTLVLAGTNTQSGGLTVAGGAVTINTAQSYGGTTTISAEPSPSASRFFLACNHRPVVSPRRFQQRLADCHQRHAHQRW